MHRDKAASIFKVTSVTDDPEEEMINKVAKMIKADIAKIKHNTSTYSSLNKDTLYENSSVTLSCLLSEISPKLRGSLAGILINHIVTSVTSGNFSMLQLALALLVRDKRVIERLHEFGVTTTYHEVRRFKASAAAAQDKNGSSLDMDASDGLVQAISDYFDATIHSQNGIKQTHALATIFAQANACEKDNHQFKFTRLKQEEVKSVKLKDVPLCMYTGPKTPEMDPKFATRGVLPLNLLCKQVLLTKRAKAEDFRFIKMSLSDDSCPDFNGFNTGETKRAGQAPKPKTRISFRELLDQTPSEPSTMLTAMVDAEKVTNATGQKITVFTADQQLYSVLLDIVWTDRDRWVFFVPRLGGMHRLMSFIGSVGVLMSGSGLKEILSSTFAGAEKMLLGKKFAMNLRALRFVVIELLRGHVERMSSYDELELWFSQLCKKRVFAEHWFKNLIKPLFLMLLYVRAEREG